ncbi:MAG: cytochrome c [Gemmataceae bacterium]
MIDVPPGYIFEVISKGFGAMPDYASQVPVRDRWAIAGYVRRCNSASRPSCGSR